MCIKLLPIKFMCSNLIGIVQALLGSTLLPFLVAHLFLQFVSYLGCCGLLYAGQSYQGFELGRALAEQLNKGVRRASFFIYLNDYSDGFLVTFLLASLLFLLVCIRGKCPCVDNVY